MLLEVMKALDARAHELIVQSQLSATLHATGTPMVARASLSIPDTLFLFVVALVVFGPKRLPEIGRQIGKLVFEFRRASNDFKLQIEEEMRISEQQEKQKTLELQAAAALKAAPAAELTTDSATAEKGLVIQAPSSGSLVEARPPNRAVVEAGNEHEPVPPARERVMTGIGGSTPEIRDAIARGTASDVDTIASEAHVDRQEAGLEQNASESATTHHG